MALTNLSLLYAICAFPLGLALLAGGIVIGRRGPLTLWSGGLALFGALLLDTAIFAIVAYFLGLAGAPHMTTFLAGGIIALNGLIFLVVIGYILLRR
ncbi:MAG: hypothetical protein R3248_08190 [Candidatus Promineifilaceae bacterium]|nr:hypothetical protein [Candidatus Promineifilaceae bacterium]